jgi:ABC-type multidrug transport system ATPase subunit
MNEGISEIILEIKHLTKRYGKTIAVNDLNLTIFKGEVFGLLGPNGAGKTTTIRSILGLTKPDAGEISVMGSVVGKGSPNVMQYIGAVLEGQANHGYLTGYDNLVLCNILNGYEVHRNIDEVLDLVSLSEKAREKASHYSLGMKQRLSLAQALIGDPNLLILDEPTNGLDPRGIRDTRHLILQLAKEKGMTILLSSHLMHEVEQTCDRIAIIDKGKLVFMGSILELKNQNKGDLEDLFIELTGGEDDSRD